MSSGLGLYGEKMVILLKSSRLRLSALLFFSMTFLAACDLGPGSFIGNRYPTTFSSNGERIYFTGTSLSGHRITAQGGEWHRMMHRDMHGGGCAGCHGDERQGRRLWPRFWVKAPALTTNALTNLQSHDHNDSAVHPLYDQDSLRVAIVQGKNPSGELIRDSMPRWSMSESDLNDLVVYLLQE